uniref:UBC core domain-containing protein n=1 Tax=Kalanchoe fedtschenkoi TaxID=63787 RepID=A0A7N0ZSM1_KALFE
MMNSGGGSRPVSWPSRTSVSSSGKRIQTEIAELNMDPPVDSSASPKGDNLYHWIATIIGPPAGNLGLGILKDGWSPALTISEVLHAVRSIFTNPDPYNPLVPGIARLYLSDRAKHDELAAKWTLRFAK